LTGLVLLLAVALAGILADAEVHPPCPSPPIPVNAVSVTAHGAKGDGRADDTAAIQAAIDAARPGGTVVVPPGTYAITVGQQRSQGLRLKSGLTFVMATDATLMALPTADDGYAVLRLHELTDVRIHGGLLLGERHRHRGSAGESGMGIAVYDSTRITINATVARAFWGDGFYFGGSSNRDLTVCGVVADDNRRNGMSIVSAIGMTVTDSTFMNTNGTAPEAGLDIEPDAGGRTENVFVARSTFRGNRGDGVAITTGCGPCAITRNNHLLDNRIIDNGKDGVVVSYQKHRVVGNLIENSGAHGIRLWNASDSVVTGNTIRRSAGAGLQLESASGGEYRNNVLERNQTAWALKWLTVDNVFEHNRCVANIDVTKPPRVPLRNRFDSNPGCPP
jgi:parallel beta-helix repeat protein